MIPDKQELEILYRSMSIDQIAKKLSISKSTLYYYMRKFNIDRRNKSEAQKHHLSHDGHQRSGKKHSIESKEKISDGSRRFWDSSGGQEQKKKLHKIQKAKWQTLSDDEKSFVVTRLNLADRPTPGQLSRFGKKLANFLSFRENIRTGIRLTPSHISDIILDDRKVVIELLFPTHIYGEAQEQRIEDRYNKIADAINSAGYRVVIIEDSSNSISNARCNRVYEQLLSFFNNDQLSRLTIIS